MRDLNKVQVIGRLGKDVELRFFDNGKPLARFSIASNRSWLDAESERHEETEWFAVVAWDRLAERCAEFLRKGDRVYIEGRLQTRSWDDQTSGQKRFMTEVVISDMITLESRSEPKAEPAINPELEPARHAQREAATPQRKPQQVQPPARRGRVPIDDTLPF